MFALAMLSLFVVMLLFCFIVLVYWMLILLCSPSWIVCSYLLDSSVLFWWVIVWVMILLNWFGLIRCLFTLLFAIRVLDGLVALGIRIWRLLWFWIYMVWCVYLVVYCLDCCVIVLYLFFDCVVLRSVSDGDWLCCRL